VSHCISHDVFVSW